MDRQKIAEIENAFYGGIFKELAGRWGRDLIIFLVFLAGAYAAFWLLKRQADKEEYLIILNRRRKKATGQEGEKHERAGEDI